jgi:hypothetical protein
MIAPALVQPSKGNSMLFELRTTAVQPSAMGRVVALAGESVGRRESSGKLEGAWVTEIGPLCRLTELWSRPDLDVAGASREANAPGVAELQPDSRDAITGVETSLLSPVLPYHPPGGTGHVYELRRYRTRPGRQAEWLEHFVGVMPTRQKYSPLVGLWRTIGGCPDEVAHLWVYDSLDRRATIRAKVVEDAEWQAFLKVGSPLLAEMNATIIVPTRFSPLQ